MFFAFSTNATEFKFAVPLAGAVTQALTSRVPFFSISHHCWNPFNTLSQFPAAVSGQRERKDQQDCGRGSSGGGGAWWDAGGTTGRLPEWLAVGGRALHSVGAQIYPKYSTEKTTLPSTVKSSQTLTTRRLLRTLPNGEARPWERSSSRLLRAVDGAHRLSWSLH